MTSDIHIYQVKKRKENARENSSGKKFPDGECCLAGHHNQHDAWRDKYAKGSSRTDGTIGQLLIIAVLSHHRQGQEPHGDDRSADYTGTGCKDCRDHYNSQCNPAFGLAEQKPQRPEEFFRNARAIEKLGHEDK